MSFQISRRSLLRATGTGITAAALAPCLSTPAQAHAARATAAGGRAFKKLFATPSTEVRPGVRWWLPSSDVDDAVLAEQLASLADGGFGRAELANLGSGFGTAAWRTHLLTALQAAKKQDLDLDVTLGPRWPAAVPTIDLNSADSSQTIVWGRVMVTAGQTYSGATPSAEGQARDGVTESVLIAVTAAKIADGSSADAEPVLLDRSTARDLTAKVTDNKITWTAPAGNGTWLLFAFWQRSEGKTVNDWPIVNHFRKSGAKAVTDYWEANVLTPQISRLLREVGAEFFEDSVELEKTTHWTEGMIGEIRRRRGYDITKHLPILMIKFAAIFDLRPVFEYADGTGQRIRNDYFETLSQLYRENHLEPLRTWANQHGMSYRAQPAYGVTVNMASAATELDIPETESLWFAEKVDAFRSMSGAVHMSGKPVFSIETDVVVPPKVGDDGYAITFPNALNLFHGHFAGYVNRLMLHGFPYTTSSAATWPGYSPFANTGGGIGESWGPRNPNWAHVDEFTGYLGRLQAVLRHGKPRVDVAVYRHAYWDRGRDNWDADNALLWNDPGLVAAGYSYDYIDPFLLDLPAAEVTGKRLAPDGPAYKALILTDVAEVLQSQATAEASAQATLQTAQKIYDYALNGLPIVIIGEPPTATPFFADTSDDTKVAKVYAKLRALHNVEAVASQAAVPAALARLGVRPDAAFASPAAHVWTVHRHTDSADLYYFYNEGKESTNDGYRSTALTRKVSFTGTGRPYRLDAWTGRIEPITTYTTSHGRTTITLKLAAHEAAVIAIAPRAWAATTPSSVHAISTNAPELRYEGSRLVARSISAGQYTTRLSTGHTRRTSVGKVPSAAFLTKWKLTVDSFTPGAEPDQTAHKKISVTLDAGLKPWPDVKELEGVSGTGRYTASFILPKDWKNTDGAVIELGEITNSARVWINGHRLDPVDLVQGRVETRGRLVPGSNRIEVEVTTTLNNRLRTQPGGSGRSVQPDGLIGVQRHGTYGVLIQPYREATVSSPRTYIR
ncbi:glycosyl hydrolase [Streptomyces shenzhenensis]|uniref:Alpha-L-rhamnosidase n=1 Tax=Streptomyces shenzhenensis TaxID=943815 RepID=A0A3M0IF30_9ACTN|nr:glycosyl hydrolase [Streptomyces shenzhenensis]RMB84879.1 hypothetical protein CTZ28_17205 [Streptomyces shenzhenensis]